MIADRALALGILATASASCGSMSAQPAAAPTETECPEWWLPLPDGTCRPGFVPPSIVYFDAYSTDLTARARQFLDGIVPRYEWRPRRITLVGHTDRVGSAAANLLRSERYAIAVRDYLVDKGIPAADIHIDARGDTRFGGGDCGWRSRAG